MLSPEPIFRVHCEVADILDLGAAPFGHRRVVNLLGGTVTGAKLNGRILPGGADWQIIGRRRRRPTSMRATPSRAMPAR